MAKRQRPGEYKVGRIEARHRDNDSDVRPRNSGDFGVIKGATAEENNHLEWSHICAGALKTSKWFTYRIGPGDNGVGVRTDLLEAFDTKTEAIEALEKRKGRLFTETY